MACLQPAEGEAGLVGSGAEKSPRLDREAITVGQGGQSDIS